MISSISSFYNNLSNDGLFFFWIVIFLFVFLIVLTIVLIIKNKKLIKTLKEDSVVVNDNDIINNNTDNSINNISIVENQDRDYPKVDNINNEESINEEVKKEIEVKEEVKKDNGLYQKNVLREMSMKSPTSPINIVKSEEYIKKEDLSNFDFNKYDNGLGMQVESSDVSPLEEMEDYYEVNDNMKFASEIVERMNEEISPSNIELTDFEKKQEEEAIISYDELLKVKDKIYNITDDEETDEFIDELKSFRIDLR